MKANRKSHKLFLLVKNTENHGGVLIYCKKMKTTYYPAPHRSYFEDNSATNFLICQGKHVVSPHFNHLGETSNEGSQCTIFMDKMENIPTLFLLPNLIRDTATTGSVKIMQ